MKSFLLLLVISLVLLVPSVSGKSPEKVALAIIRNTNINPSVNQLLVVFNRQPADETALLFALDRESIVPSNLGKNRNSWKIVYGSVNVGIGKKGFAAPGMKREGDKMSPTGLFGLGQLFSYENKVNTHMYWVQSTADDKWIDDTESPDYNHHVRGITSAKSFENLKIRTNDYKYCMVIEYNTHPVVKGNGSAIFLHLPEGREINASAGCVVTCEKDMEWLLNWMVPSKKPSILMGNASILLKCKTIPVN